MSQMINDTLQNIYNRIAQMGQSLTKLQQSIEGLTKTLEEKVQKVVETIVQMKDSQEKEGEAFKFVLESAGDNFTNEVKKLQSKIGLKDLEELTEKLKQISKTSQETLKPETVDVLLSEVLNGIKFLTGAKKQEEEEETEEE